MALVTDTHTKTEDALDGRDHLTVPHRALAGEGLHFSDQDPVGMPLVKRN